MIIFHAKVLTKMRFLFKKIKLFFDAALVKQH